MKLLSEVTIQLLEKCIFKNETFLIFQFKLVTQKLINRAQDPDFGNLYESSDDF